MEFDDVYRHIRIAPPMIEDGLVHAPACTNDPCTCDESGAITTRRTVLATVPKFMLQRWGTGDDGLPWVLFVPRRETLPRVYWGTQVFATFESALACLNGLIEFERVGLEVQRMYRDE